MTVPRNDNSDPYDYYILHIYTEETPERVHYNHYGYWNGQDYRRRGNVYPRLERDVSDDTKRYRSFKTASNAVAMIHKRYDRVIHVALVGVIGDTLKRLAPLDAHDRRPYGTRR